MIKKLLILSVFGILGFSSALHAQQPVNVVSIPAILGNLTNNNAAPTTTNLGVLPCLYNTAAPTTSDGKQGLLSCDTSGGLRSNITNTSIAVTGTFFQSTQPVSCAAASTCPVNATQVTNPWIVAGGGTAGSAASGVLTVQGIASMTHLLVTPDANSAINLAQVNGTTVLVNTGAVGTGSARVAVGQDTATIAGSAPGTAGSASANVVTVQGVASMTHLLVTPDANSSVNEVQLNGTTIDTNSGNKSAGTQRIVIATDQPNLTTALNVALAANQSVNVAQIAGTTTSVNNGATDAGTTRVTISNDSTGQVITAPSAASGEAVTACNILSTASTNATNCKNGAGNFYGYEVFNNTTTIAYLRLYNLTTSPTCSSATGFIRTIPVPPAAAAGQAGGAISNQEYPVNYGTGIGYCITGGSTSTDNSNAVAGIFGEIRYK